MHDRFKTTTTLSLAACLFSLLVSPASANTTRDTVTSEGNRVVVSTDGSCVRTKWQSGNDACAPKQAAPAPKPQPAVAPAAAIEKNQRTVYFDFNKDTLRPDTLKTLDQLIGLIKANDRITSFHVVGYVDPIGGESKKNIALSQSRADAVKNHLAAVLKIPSDSSVRGLGVSHTAECNKNKNRKKRIVCLQPDRRVEVELTYKEE